MPQRAQEGAEGLALCGNRPLPPSTLACKTLARTTMLLTLPNCPPLLLAWAVRMSTRRCPLGGARANVSQASLATGPRPHAER